TVVIPVIGDPGSIKIPASAEATKDTRVADATKVATGTYVASAKGARIKINGIATIKANAAETPAQLATRAGVDLSDFLKWNDIDISDRVEADQYYLLGKKRVRGSESYHKAAAGDNLWKVSQEYGVQLKKLKKYNRMPDAGQLVPGTTIWLTSVKLKDSEKVASSVSSAEIVQVDNSQSFAWSASPGTSEEVQAQATVSLKPIVVATSVVETQQELTPKATDSLETIQAKNTIVDTAQAASIKVIPPALLKEEHVVETGETLYGIAKIYSLEVMDLVGWNNLNLQDGIRPGQVIKLKENQPVETDREVSQKNIEIVHVVKSTDTLYSVARKYNVTIQELMEWNNKKDFTLAVGEKLTIKSK
ncbi:MAG TPA: LysM peptidoglycan-binding domain-containing protein, partial [Chryseolinea sp.]|nr:LysM peptidoglycan-binding domain-containing protein [Chryseolinea sp.]